MPATRLSLSVLGLNPHRSPHGKFEPKRLGGVQLLLRRTQTRRERGDARGVPRVERGVAERRLDLGDFALERVDARGQRLQLALLPVREFAGTIRDATRVSRPRIVLLRRSGTLAAAGRIQQAAAPMEVYEKPANTFVASFIGTPPMNLFPPGVYDLARTVGVRPEHVRVAWESDAAAAGAPGALRATADIVEMLGSETIVHAIVDGRKLSVLARVPGVAGVAHGDRLVLVPDMSRAVIFDDK